MFFVKEEGRPVLPSSSFLKQYGMDGTGKPKAGRPSILTESAFAASEAWLLSPIRSLTLYFTTITFRARLIPWRVMNWQK